jgi:hypothetical protein
VSYDPNDTKIIGLCTKRYRLTCDKCGRDRGYGMKSRSTMPCKRCSHAGKDYIGERTIEYRTKMSAAKKGQVPHNKSQMTPEHLQLRNNISSLMGHYLSDRRYNQHRLSKLTYLDFSIPQLKAHLEARFLPGMSWDNYGRKSGIRCWHIDHVTPDSWFDYSSPQDRSFKECWSLDNLQPKWEDENLKKSNKYIG